MHSRRAMSLMELLAVLAILGLLVGAAASIMRIDSLGNYGAETAANTLAKDLQQARRRAISTGDEHYLGLTLSGSSITGYTIYRFDGSTATVVDALRDIPDQVTATITPAASQTPSFTFEGQTASSFVFTLSGPGMGYDVTVTAATGRPEVVAN